MDAEELADFKRYVIERSRSPADMPDARQRALMACLDVPQPVQKWMVEIGAAEPLFASIAKTIEDAEKHVRDEATMQERARCAEIVHQQQIAFCSDACGWALDKIKDGLPANAVRVAK